MPQNQKPLLFLTTTSSTVPTGLNARAQARTRSAQASNPVVQSSTARGGFHTWRTSSAASSSTSSKPTHRNPGSTGTSTAKFEAVNKITKRIRSSYPSSTIKARGREQRMRRTDPSPKSAPNVPSRASKRSQTKKDSSTDALRSDDTFDAIDDLFTLTNFHIRRMASRTAVADPTRLEDVLRCRTWAGGMCCSSWRRRMRKEASVQRTEVVDAVACLRVKMRGILGEEEEEGGQRKSDVKVWEMYEVALSSLRKAMVGLRTVDTDLGEEGGIMVAARLLAVFEMLNWFESGLLAPGKGWERHLDGATALERSTVLQKHGTAVINSPASALLVEALLNQQDFNHWNDLKDILYGPVLTEVRAIVDEDLLKSLLEGAELVTFPGNKMRMDSNGRLKTLTCAHEVRDRLSALIVSGGLFDANLALHAIPFDILSLCLATVIGLDRLILDLRPESTKYLDEDIEAKTQDFAVQVLADDLRHSDRHPPPNLIQVFSRQSSI